MNYLKPFVWICLGGLLSHCSWSQQPSLDNAIARFNHSLKNYRIQTLAATNYRSQFQEIGLSLKLKRYKYTATWLTNNNIRPRFYLEIYSFKDIATAQKLLKKVYQSASPDFGFSKGWAYVLRYQNHLFWLNSTCVYSAANWHKITQLLEQHLRTKPTNQRLDKIDCKCGGGCVGDFK
mgnify:FL=1